MGDTIEDMDIEIEQTDNKIENFENKMGVPDSSFVEEKKKLGLNKRSSKTKADRIMDRLYNSLNNHN